MQTLNQLTPMFIQLFYESKVNHTETSLMETSSSLFMNDLLSTDLIANRFLKIPHYVKNPDNSLNIDMSSIIVDTQSFYLFSHKLLVSALLIMNNYFPKKYIRENQFSPGNFGKFYNYVYKGNNDLTERIRSKMESELNWAKNKIIDKRDKMIQHWTTNPQNQLMTTIHVFDLPIITYQHPKKFNSSIDKQRLSYWTEKIVKKYHLNYSVSTDSGSNLAFLEGFYPKLIKEEKSVVDGFLNPELFIALPFNSNIIEELSSYLKKTLEIIQEVRKIY
jgi:hypothetical protein